MSESEILNLEYEGESLAKLIRFEHIPYSKCKEFIQSLPQQRKENWIEFYLSPQKGISFNNIRSMRQPKFFSEPSLCYSEQKNEIQVSIFFPFTDSLEKDSLYHGHLVANERSWKIEIHKSSIYIDKVFLGIYMPLKNNSKNVFNFKDMSLKSYFDSTRPSSTEIIEQNVKKLIAYCNSQDFIEYLNVVRKLDIKIVIRE